MVGVASQIIFCIFAAAVIGSVAGYLIRGLRHGARVAEIERLWKAKLHQRDGEIAALRGAGAVPSSLSSVVENETGSPHSSALAPENNAQSPVIPNGNVSQFENKLSEALSLIEKLARSQERMENELIALRKNTPDDFKLEPPTRKR